MKLWNQRSRCFPVHFFKKPVLIPGWAEDIAFTRLVLFGGVIFCGILLELI